MKYVTYVRKISSLWQRYVLIKRLEDAMSMTNRIQKNTNWIKLAKDMLFYYLEVGNLFYNYENKKFHISTKIKRKHTYSITLKWEMFFTIMKI